MLGWLPVEMSVWMLTICVYNYTYSEGVLLQVPWGLAEADAPGRLRDPCQQLHVPHATIEQTLCIGFNESK